MLTRAMSPCGLTAATALIDATNGARVDTNTTKKDHATADVRLARFGVFQGSGALASDLGAAGELAAHLEQLGFGTMWIGSANGDLVVPDQILAATTRLSVATGIVNIWQYQAADVAANQRRVAEA